MKNFVYLVGFLGLIAPLYLIAYKLHIVEQLLSIRPISNPQFAFYDLKNDDLYACEVNKEKLECKTLEHLK